MPAYYYLCDPNQKGCGQEVELLCQMADLDEKEKVIKCPKCKKHKPLHRIYSGTTCASAYIPKTVGSLADKNGKSFSEEYKEHLIEKGRAYDPKEKSWISTPDGLVHKSKLNKQTKKKKGKK